MADNTAQRVNASRSEEMKELIPEAPQGDIEVEARPPPTHARAGAARPAASEGSGELRIEFKQLMVGVILMLGLMGFVLHYRVNNDQMTEAATRLERAERRLSRVTGGRFAGPETRVKVGVRAGTAEPSPPPTPPPAVDMSPAPKAKKASDIPAPEADGDEVIPRRTPKGATPLPAVVAPVPETDADAPPPSVRRGSPRRTLPPRKTLPPPAPEADPNAGGDAGDVPETPRPTRRRRATPAPAPAEGDEEVTPSPKPRRTRKPQTPVPAPGEDEDAPTPVPKRTRKPRPVPREDGDEENQNPKQPKPRVAPPEDGGEGDATPQTQAPVRRRKVAPKVVPEDEA